MSETQTILANAFSINMLNVTDEEIKIKVKKISLEEAKKILSSGFVSAIGHASTAQLLSQMLNMEVPANRVEIKLAPGQLLVVFQLMARLQEGKILSQEELQQLLREGKAVFYLVELLS